MTSRHEDPGRVWLDVPFAEKDQAKSLGARWDPMIGRWYAPAPAVTNLARWAALPDVPDLLPGEDRSDGVVAVPSPTAETNRPCAPRCNVYR